MNYGRLFFIGCLAVLFAGWFAFLESGLEMVTVGSYVIMLVIWLVLNIIITIIGVHEMT